MLNKFWLIFFFCVIFRNMLNTWMVRVFFPVRLFFFIPKCAFRTIVFVLEKWTLVTLSHGCEANVVGVVKPTTAIYFYWHFFLKRFPFYFQLICVWFNKIINFTVYSHFSTRHQNKNIKIPILSNCVQSKNTKIPVQMIFKLKHLINRQQQQQIKIHQIQNVAFHANYNKHRK